MRAQTRDDPQPAARGLAPTVVRARLSEVDLPPLAGIEGPWPGTFVRVGGNDVHVRRTPALDDGAEPALCVHGLGGSSQNWTDLAGLLRPRLEVEAMDLPGFGQSGPAPSGDYSLPAMVRTVIDYLRQSRRGPVHLIGNSMGGAICIHVAAQRPDLVRTLTLISPAVPDLVRWRVHPLRYDPLLAIAVVPWVADAALRRLGRVAADKRIAATLQMVFAEPSRASGRRRQEAVDELAARSELPWANDALLRATRGLVRSQLLQGRSGWAALRRVRVPALVLWGDSDKLVAPDLAHPVAAALADARLLVLESTGHVAMMEDPVTTARAVLGLVEDRC